MTPDHHHIADALAFATRSILLIGESQRELAIAAVRNAPLGIECLLRSPVKARKLDQNALYWAGPLKDIEEQAWSGGRQYSAVIWHEHFKSEFLPEDDAADLPELVKSPFTWRKFDWTPGGDRVLVGSTTDLTVKGFSQYLEQVHAFGANLGVMFHVR